MTEDDYIDIQSLLRSCDFYLKNGTKSIIPEVAADFIDRSVARIEKLEAALIAIKAMHHDGGIDDLQERDDRTYCMVCDALEGKDD